MANGFVQRYKSGKHLLKSLTDNPALPAFIPTLEPSRLGHLIQEIGIADSAFLLEHSTPTLLAAVVDDAVWTNPMPGKPERFDPAEFINWLEVLLEVGDEFAASRVIKLDEDLLVTALHYYLNVSDRDLVVVEPGQQGQIESLPSACRILVRA